MYDCLKGDGYKGKNKVAEMFWGSFLVVHCG